MTTLSCIPGWPESQYSRYLWFIPDMHIIMSSVLCMQTLGSMVHEWLLTVSEKVNPGHGQGGYIQKSKTNNSQTQLGML